MEREFHEGLLEADGFEELPGKWQTAVLKALIQGLPLSVQKKSGGAGTPSDPSPSGEKPLWFSKTAELSEI